MWARASGPDDNPYVAVTATFEDGSKQSMDVNDDVFNDIFRVGIVRASKKALVTVHAVHDASMIAEDELDFDYKTQRTFVCEGNTGRTGLDLDGDGAKLYDGQRGEDGPSIKVEIALSDDGSDDEQVLNYRLTCDDKTEQFKASAASEVSVQSIGGNGGYALPGANGEGHNGGMGGDGGDIEIIVDPSVKKYNVTAVSTPGNGGNQSDQRQTNDSDEGTKGRAGSKGHISTKKATVQL
jgi:hypothetical protein